jgi:hypothetical protein
MSITYYPPEGIEIYQFRVTLPLKALYDTIFIDNIKGKFRQFDAIGNLLSEVDIDIPRGGNQVIPASSGVDHCQLYITYYRTYISSSAKTYGIDRVITGSGNEVIIIATEDSGGSETSSLRLTAYKVVTRAKAYEEVTVVGEQPTRVFTITTANTNPYILGWMLRITDVSGSPDPDVDRVYMQLLDENDNILVSGNVGVGVGNILFIEHNTSAVKVRVYLSTNKRLIVRCAVSELVNPTYGVP